ncbi:MAG: DUF1580 domain-containing protein [Phycisphaerae bacterium]|jgi:hypothetical protein
MISVSHEDLIPLREAPRHLPGRANGKRLHVSAVYRWVKHGVKGIRLETVSIGGTTYTSAEALQRFADQLTARRSLHADDPHTLQWIMQSPRKEIGECRFSRDATYH